MSDVLRVYDPPECDAAGVPLDYERCRHCKGSGIYKYTSVGYAGRPSCHVCGGHGSLKAAALAARHRAVYTGAPEVWGPPRCEGCGHPMGDGTWLVRNEETGPALLPQDYLGLERFALDLLRRGVEFLTLDAMYWSPCDEGCRHGMPWRWRAVGDDGWEAASRAEGDDEDGAVGEIVAQRALVQIEASWRAVDVRTLGWAADLRPEKLAVLCSRCWAERGR